jgi:hypothetical protein
MVVGLCERLGRKVRVVHNDTCIYEWTPERQHRGEMIVFSVWGDHAFFYQDARGAQTLKVGKVSAVPAVKLACRLNSERVAYADMEPWESKGMPGSCCPNSPPVAKKGNAKTFRTNRGGDPPKACRRAAAKIRYR